MEENDITEPHCQFQEHSNLKGVSKEEEEDEEGEDNYDVNMGKNDEDENEDDVEEYEIDLEYLLTKSQYEDEEGNVFIYEQGEQIFLGLEELQMLDDFARQKEYMMLQA